MNVPPKILMVHQGSELYGSDRSFVASVQAARERFPDSQIDVVLPANGPLVELLRPFATQLVFESRGILRKVELRKTPLRAIFRLICAARYFDRLFSRYDVCYVNTIVCVSAIFALRSQSARKIVHVREIPSSFQCRAFGSLLNYSRAEIIYNSNATADALGIMGTVIHNGVSVAAPKYPREEKRSRELRLLIIGRINLWKGQKFVLGALAKYGKDINAHVRIVGDVFPGYEELRDELHEMSLNCSQRVDLVGFSKEAASEISWSDFVLVPSVLPEPFGRVAIESFAAGRPVIASNSGGLREIVTDGADGFLFEPANEGKFIEVLRHAMGLVEENYQLMCANAKNKYESNFTESNYRKRVAQIISGSQKDLPEIQIQPTRLSSQSK